MVYFGSFALGHRYNAGETQHDRLLKCCCGRVPITSIYFGLSAVHLRRRWTLVSLSLLRVCSHLTWLFLDYEPDIRQENMFSCRTGSSESSLRPSRLVRRAVRKLVVSTRCFTATRSPSSIQHGSSFNPYHIKSAGGSRKVELNSHAHTRLANTAAPPPPRS